MNHEEMINSAFIGLWSRVQDEQLRFVDFNGRDKGHLCVLKLATMIREVYGFDVIVKVGRIKGWFLRKWYKLNFFAQPKMAKGISIEGYVKLIEDTYGQNCLADYYNAFLNERKK